MRLPPGIVDEWKHIQLELASRRVVEPLGELPRFVVGADCAFLKNPDRAVAAALVWDREGGRVVEQAVAVVPLDVPYVPTYLSFREGEALHAAIGKLRHPYDVLCFDGQGIAHPRRCGLATHVGVQLDRRSVGFAKSRLTGTLEGEAPTRRGERTNLLDRGEVVGAALCTRDGTRPIFVSVGHRIDLDGACALALACAARWRVPEPTRLADQLVARAKRGTVPLSDAATFRRAK
jgi:deoxyribonuclease V